MAGGAALARVAELDLREVLIAVVLCANGSSLGRIRWAWSVNDALTVMNMGGVVLERQKVDRSARGEKGV